MKNLDMAGIDRAGVSKCMDALDGDKIYDLGKESLEARLGKNGMELLGL